MAARCAGSPAAALSLSDGRVVADPFRRTDHLVACLHIRANAILAYEANPSLSDRLRAAVRTRTVSPSGPGVRGGGTTQTPACSQPRLRWTHLPGTGPTARWSPAY